MKWSKMDGVQTWMGFDDDLLEIPLYSSVVQVFIVFIIYGLIYNP